MNNYRNDDPEKSYEASLIKVGLLQNVSIAYFVIFLINILSSYSQGIEGISNILYYAVMASGVMVFLAAVFYQLFRIYYIKRIKSIYKEELNEKNIC